jgi:hypothetical protein
MWKAEYKSLSNEFIALYNREASWIDMGASG